MRVLSALTPTRRGPARNLPTRSSHLQQRLRSSETVTVLGGLRSRCGRSARSSRNREPAAAAARRASARRSEAGPTASRSPSTPTTPAAPGRSGSSSVARWGAPARLRTVARRPRRPLLAPAGDGRGRRHPCGAHRPRWPRSPRPARERLARLRPCGASRRSSRPVPAGAGRAAAVARRDARGADRRERRDEQRSRASACSPGRRSAGCCSRSSRSGVVFVADGGDVPVVGALHARHPARHAARREAERRRDRAACSPASARSRRIPALRVVIGLTAAQTFVAGVFEVLLVVLALRDPHAGTARVGWLNAAHRGRRARSASSPSPRSRAASGSRATSASASCSGASRSPSSRSGRTSRSRSSSSG